MNLQNIYYKMAAAAADFDPLVRNIINLSICNVQAYNSGDGLDTKMCINKSEGKYALMVIVNNETYYYSILPEFAKFMQARGTDVVECKFLHTPLVKFSFRKDGTNYVCLHTLRNADQQTSFLKFRREELNNTMLAICFTQSYHGQFQP